MVMNTQMPERYVYINDVDVDFLDNLYGRDINAMKKYSEKEERNNKITAMKDYAKVTDLMYSCNNYDGTTELNVKFLLPGIGYAFNIICNKALFEKAINGCLFSGNEQNDPLNQQTEICLNIDRVIFNDPATIILWKSYHFEDRYHEDGTYDRIKVQDKTIVKCSPGEKFNKYNGFCAAVTKRIFETNSNIQRIIKNAQDDSIHINPKNKSDKKPIKKAIKKMERELKKK